MQSRAIRLSGIFTLFAIVPLLTFAAEPGQVTRDMLGRGVKLRVVIDKVMQPTEGWVTKEWMVKSAAEAGFNVFSPRSGHDRLGEVRDVTRWCAKYGIFHMPWMRGSLRAPDGSEADGKRMVWANGSEQPLWSPNSDEFWEWTNKYIVEYARISAEDPHLMGVFLDYENYSPGGQGNLYSLSYDDVILDLFAKARELTLPELPFGERQAWLEDEGLHDAFEAFQVDYWRMKCRELRKAVDEHDPGFMLCIYPAPGTPFMLRATYPEWATESAPLILADASTYGRPSRFMPQEEALEANRQKLAGRMETPRETGVPFIYTGGIDPIVGGADPEFCGKNAVMISEVTGGYWIFYEGPEYDKDHPAYWRWFSWANQAIAEGRFEAWHEPRETKVAWLEDLFGGTPRDLDLLAPEVTGDEVTFPMVRLRRDNMVLIAARKGLPIEAGLKHYPLSDYVDPLTWQVRGPGLEQVAKGQVAYGERGVLRFEPPEDGVYMALMSAGACAYALESSTAPVGLVAADGLSLIGAADRLYFHVPEEAASFKVQIRGFGGETVRAIIFDPEGKEVADGQTSFGEQKVDVAVDTKGHEPGVWAVRTLKAGQGVIEDNRVRLRPPVSPVVSLVPEHVFRRRD